MESDFPKGVAKPATRALNAAGYHALADLAGASRSKLADLHGVGDKALEAIEGALRSGDLTPLKN